MTIPISEQLKVRRKQDLNLMINPAAQEAKKASVTPTPKKTKVKRIFSTPKQTAKRETFKGITNRGLPASINDVGNW